MAAFKVGQRVRFVKTDNPALADLVGREATIVSIPAWSSGDCSITIDGALGRTYGGFLPSFATLFTHIAPLTDPKADEFIERIKKLGNEPMPLSPADLETVRGGA